MAFHEVQFPTNVSRGSSGGPRRMTDIVTLRSGYEFRNSLWANSRRTYNAGLGLRQMNDLYEALEFFESRRGMLHGFRWKDWADYKSGPPTNEVTNTDQEIGTGDGATRVFRLKKRYGNDDSSYDRFISKPILESVVVSIDGIATEDFSVDPSTGQVFLEVSPSLGKIIRAGFEFDVPVRFNQDELLVNVENFDAGMSPDISIIEIRFDESNELTSLYNLGSLGYTELNLSLQEIIEEYEETMENY